MHTDVLVCPETRLPLAFASLAEARGRVAGGGQLVGRPQDLVARHGPTDPVLVRSDDACAYPVVDGVPVLLAPEMLCAADEARRFDMRDPRYREAYEEMEHYDSVARANLRLLEAEGRFESPVLDAVLRIHAAGSTSPTADPELWLSSVYDCAAESDVYAHLEDVAGAHVMQLGGSGLHAVKLLLAGALEAWLLTPMLGEALLARAVARRVGVAERLACVLGVAEELPFAAGSLDAVVSVGSVHHTRTAVAFAEIARVLRPGGRFAAVEPWRAPFYGVGTRLLGKRDAGAQCEPFTATRLQPLEGAFATTEVVHHGALTRYVLIGLSRLGIRLPLRLVRRIYTIDDAVSSLIPPLRRSGSSIALLATR